MLTGIQNSDSLDTTGIELIDTAFANTINKHYEMLIPFFKEKIKKYMKDHKITEMSYDELRQEIDDRYQDYIIYKIINANTNLFTPVNLQRQPDGFQPYGIKINQDSILNKTK